MDVWRCKVLLRYGIRNNVGLYRCRLCGGAMFFFLCFGTFVWTSADRNYLTR
jgi:hypothetical protein